MSSRSDDLIHVDCTLYLILILLFTNSIALDPSIFLTLDSWVPILRHLPELCLDQNIYVSHAIIYR